MRMLSAPVAGAAAVLTAPALYQALVLGTMPVEMALTRYAVAMLIAWIGLSIVETLIGEPPTRVRVEPDDAAASSGTPTATG